MQRREDVREYLNLQRELLQAQLEVDAMPHKGAVADWEDHLPLSALETRSLEAKQPIVQFLDLTVFDTATLKPIFRKVVDVFATTYPNRKGLDKLLGRIDGGEIDLATLIAVVLKEDDTVLMRYAMEYEVEVPLLTLLVTTPIQPFFEDIARRASPAFYEKWWRANCPICGRVPQVARLLNRQRYLLCDFCGSEYRSDYSLCVNCGNRDPYTLKFLKNEAKPEFQIDFCTKCNHYLKVILEDARKTTIPRRLEDILTLNLDVEAKRAGLIRNY